jgi:hypothetical protein
MLGGQLSPQKQVLLELSLSPSLGLEVAKSQVEFLQNSPLVCSCRAFYSRPATASAPWSEGGKEGPHSVQSWGRGGAFSWMQAWLTPSFKYIHYVHVLIRQTYIRDIAYCKDCPHGAGRKRREEWCRLSAQARKGAEACCSSARLRLEISLALKSPEIDDPQGWLREPAGGGCGNGSCGGRGGC